jgi:hypothetical protein
MQRATVRQRVEFENLILAHVPKASQSRFDFAARLMRYGSTLGRLAEEQCNGYQDWKGNWDEKATARAEARVEKLCAEFGCKADFQGDPRGNTLKIIVPDGFTNDWGRTGICVPTS